MKCHGKQLFAFPGGRCIGPDCRCQDTWLCALHRSLATPEDIAAVVLLSSIELEEQAMRALDEIVDRMEQQTEHAANN